MEKSKMKMIDKNSKINTLILHFALSFFILIFPFSISYAANVYLDTARTEFFVGDTILVEVKVDTEGRAINTVEGKISLDYLLGVILVRDISLSESSFSLWPDKPLLSDDLRTISFVGGSPGGLEDQDAILFKIALQLKNEGAITLNPSGISVYLHDGKGTQDIVDIEGLTINVLPQGVDYEPTNDLDTLISGDKTPPEPFEIVVGQDDSVFEGKKFLSFNTTDGQSGVRYYEVREGNLPPTRSNGTYVLMNQDKSTKVTVVAYDSADNARESVYEPGRSYSGLILVTVLAILLLVIIFVVRSKLKNQRLK